MFSLLHTDGTVNLESVLGFEYRARAIVPLDLEYTSALNMSDAELDRYLSRLALNAVFLSEYRCGPNEEFTNRSASDGAFRCVCRVDRVCGDDATTDRQSTVVVLLAVILAVLGAIAVYSIGKVAWHAAQTQVSRHYARVSPRGGGASRGEAAGDG